MAKDPEQPKTFEFQLLGDEQSAKPKEQEASPVKLRAAMLYSLNAHRTAQASKEAARHFSAILNLIAHLK